MNKTPHKHAEVIKAWADGAEIELSDGGEWLTMHVDYPQWHPDVNYRVKIEKISIGVYKINPPMKMIPDVGTGYYSFRLGFGQVVYDEWSANTHDYGQFSAGNCWYTREDAEIAATSIAILLSVSTK